MFDPSSTDRYGEYIQEDWQLTHGEAVRGVRDVYVLDRVCFEDLEFPATKLVVIDGELRPLVDEAPPDLKPLTTNAGILHVGEEKCPYCGAPRE